MKRRVLWTVIAGTVLAAVGSCTYLESSAASKAKTFCKRFPPGSYMADVAYAARNEGDARHRSMGLEEISIAHIGIPPFSRHMCIYTGESGRVSKARYAYLD